MRGWCGKDLGVVTRGASGWGLLEMLDCGDIHAKSLVTLTGFVSRGGRLDGWSYRGGGVVR